MEAVKPGYKKTEIGVIPEDWEVKALGDIVNYMKGYAFKSSDYKSSGIRVIRVSDTSYDAIEAIEPIFIDDSQLDRFKKWILNENDLIVSTVGSKPPMYASLVGRVNLVTWEHADTLLNQNAVKIVAKNGSYYLQMIIFNNMRTDRYLDHIWNIFRGNANQASITLLDLFKFQIPLPPTLEEQRAIADALSEVDAAITVLDDLIAKKRDLKQGAMQRLLTGEERLPGFSGEWGKVTLDQVGTFKKGKNIPKSALVNEGIPCVLYGEIYTKYNFISRDLTSRIPIEIASASVEIQKGDILFAGSGETLEDIGKCFAYIGNERAYAGGDIIILSPNESNSIFLGYLLNSPHMRNLKSNLGQGSSVIHIYTTNLSKLEVSLPSSEEQTAIATALSNMDAEISALEAKREKIVALKQGMMQELLTGKTRLI